MVPAPPLAVALPSASTKPKEEYWKPDPALLPETEPVGYLLAMFWAMAPTLVSEFLELTVLSETETEPELVVEAPPLFTRAAPRQSIRRELESFMVFL